MLIKIFGKLSKMNPKFSSNQRILDSISAFCLLDDKECQKHFVFLLEAFQNLIAFPENEEFRQFVFPSSSFTAGHFLLEFFVNNGFIKCDIDSEIYLMYTEPSIESLKPIPEFIKNNYIPKKSEKEEKAAEIADKYENRINKPNPLKKPENSLINNKPASMKSINHEYMQARQNVDNDLKDYRNKMKELHSNGVNNNQDDMKNIDNLNKKEEKIYEEVENNQKVDQEMIEITNDNNKNFVPLPVDEKNTKRENVFGFQNRRENEQRTIDAQNQLQQYREEMKKRNAQGNKQLFPKRETDLKVNENYEQILIDCLKEKGLNKKTKAASMIELEKQRILEDQVRFGIKLTFLIHYI